MKERATGERRSRSSPFVPRYGVSILLSVQLALARPDVKERGSSDDGVAGWMTATARADIGARFEARAISVGLGLRTDV